VFYIRTGKVKLTVVSKTGKEATIAILGTETSLEKVRLRVKHFAWALQSL
jgi:hypothetical protein